MPYFVLLGTLGFLPAMLLLVPAPCRYATAPPELHIRAGLLLRTRLPLDAIQQVRPSRNPLSAPAWSLDRLRIDYRKGTKTRFALISPAERDAFLRSLLAAAPGLARTPDGSGLVRTQKAPAASVEPAPPR